jgi:DNA modification methylase
MIIMGDALKTLRELDAESIDSCVTSPPYWGLRDYGVDGQLGLEQTPQQFVDNMVQVFEEVRRVLKPQGTLWLNIGDSYVSSGGTGHQGKHGDRATRTHTQRNLLGKTSGNGLKVKDLVGVPWRLAFALQQAGWYLRQDIIWHKPNPMPESTRDRCTKAHEYIFLLSKSAKYYFDNEAIKEPSVTAAREAKWAGRKSGLHSGESHSGSGKSTRRFAVRPAGWGTGDQPRTAIELQQSGTHRKETGAAAETYVLSDKRNKRSVWTVGSKPFKGAHFATFPPALIEPCILAGTPPGGTVLDPFFGAGTTGLVAKKHGRNYLGIELNPEYAALAHSRLHHEI